MVRTIILHRNHQPECLLFPPIKYTGLCFQTKVLTDMSGHVMGQNTERFGYYISRGETAMTLSLVFVVRETLGTL